MSKRIKRLHLSEYFADVCVLLYVDDVLLCAMTNHISRFETPLCLLISVLSLMGVKEVERNLITKACSGVFIWERRPRLLLY